MAGSVVPVVRTSRSYQYVVLVGRLNVVPVCRARLRLASLSCRLVVPAGRVSLSSVCRAGLSCRSCRGWLLTRLLANTLHRLSNAYRMDSKRFDAPPCN